MFGIAHYCLLVQAECVRTNVVRALADLVATKLDIIISFSVLPLWRFTDSTMAFRGDRTCFYLHFTTPEPIYFTTVKTSPLERIFFHLKLRKSSIHLLSTTIA